jgi:pyridoxal phosphate enzyme (YggS family)
LLVAVSKTVNARQVAQAASAGIRDFGENRSGTLHEKQALFPEYRWHFIGRIQTNKLKDYVGKVALIHSVASYRALEAIDRRAHSIGCVQELLIEVNVLAEASKDGVAPEQLADLLSAARALKSVCVRGLMTMAPLGSPAAARHSFAGLRRLRDDLAADFADANNVRLTELSMGMSDDMEIAVEEGATIVRVGRRLWT